MSSKRFLSFPVCLLLLGHAISAFAAEKRWVAQTNSNLNTASNWSPASVPVSGDIATFNSSFPQIVLAPTANADFTTGTMNFPVSANAFTFSISNAELIFDGTSVGIVGTNINPKINVVNSNNTLGTSQISMTGSVANTLGSAAVSIVNNAVDNSYSIPYQFNCASTPFTFANGASFSLSNIGMATTTSSYITTHQSNFGSNFTGGNNLTFSFINSGTGLVGSNSANVGFIQNNGNQFNVGGVFTVGDLFNLSLANIGVSGNNSTSNNCGVAGGQAIFNSSFVAGSGLAISIANTGTSGGSGNTAVGNLQSDWQFRTGGMFYTGDSLFMSIANSATNTTNATGTNSVGVIALGQASMVSTFFTGSNSSVNIANIGSNYGTSTSSCVIGSVGQYQFNPNSDVIAGNAFTLNIANTGYDDGSGSGSNQVGIVTGGQVLVSGAFSAQSNATMNISNLGTNPGATTNSQIGYVGSDQCIFSGNFNPGDDLNLTVASTGISSGNQTGNVVGSIANNQLYFQSPVYIGDSGSITVSSTGNNSDGSSNQVGCIGRFPFRADGNFNAGDDFKFTMINSGVNTSTGTNNNVGVLLNGYQAYFASNIVLGDNATINFLNSGSYAGTDTNTQVGVVQDQIVISGTFTAGENLNFIVQNLANNPNGLSTVGTTINQMVFGGLCTFNNGTLISAINTGTLATQFGFNGGFVLNGKATFEAINRGVLGGTGMSITNAYGGDVNIVLENSSLVVDNSGLGSPFTMGALNGDSLSTVTCAQGLIIDTDAGVTANFAGTINSMPSITKNGLGTQILSGTVDPTSPSFVNAGVLSVTGSFTGDIDITAAGTLAGSGTIAGTVTNDGTIEPTQTLTMTHFVNNSDGTFDVQLSATQGNGKINSTGTATLNGGELLVGTSDGTYLFGSPYTALTSTGLTGTFSSVQAVSPLIRPLVVYSGNNVILTLRQNIGAAAITHNQKAVASVLDATLDPSVTQSLLLSQIVDLSNPDARKALDSLSGVQYANEPFFAQTVNRQFVRRLYDPIRVLVTDPFGYAHCNDITTWAEAGGDFTRMQGNQLNGFQVTLGGQKQINSEWTLGIAASYEGDCISFAHHGGSEYANNGLIGLYTLYRPDTCYFILDGAFGFTSSEMKRKIHVGNNTYHAKGHLENSEVTLYGEAGIDILSNYLLIQPFVGIEGDGIWRNSVSESSSSGWELDVHWKKQWAAFSRVGAHISTYRSACGFMASLDLSWDYQFTRNINQMNGGFDLFAGSFNIDGTKLDRNSFEYAFTLLEEVSECWSVYLETTGQIWNRAQTFTVLGGASYNW